MKVLIRTVNVVVYRLIIFIVLIFFLDLSCPKLGLSLGCPWAVLELICPRLEWANLGVGNPWCGQPLNWDALILACPWIELPLAQAALCSGKSWHGLASAWAAPNLGSAWLGQPPAWATLSFTCSHFPVFALLIQPSLSVPFLFKTPAKGNLRKPL